MDCKISVLFMVALYWSSPHRKFLRNFKSDFTLFQEIIVKKEITALNNDHPKFNITATLASVNPNRANDL